MPDIEALQLVERFFAIGARVVGSSPPVAIFLAGCRECLPEWEIHCPRGQNFGLESSESWLWPTRAGGQTATCVVEGQNAETADSPPGSAPADGCGREAREREAAGRQPGQSGRPFGSGYSCV